MTDYWPITDLWTSSCKLLDLEIPFLIIDAPRMQSHVNVLHSLCDTLTVTVTITVTLQVQCTQSAECKRGALKVLQVGP